MADNHLDNPYKNVTVLDMGTQQLDPNQIGINLVNDTMGQGSVSPSDPVIEVAMVTRRASGLLESEISIIRRDSLAKMAEHLTLRSNYESAVENEMLTYDDDEDDNGY